MTMLTRLTAGKWIAVMAVLSVPLLLIGGFPYAQDCMLRAEGYVVVIDKLNEQSTLDMSPTERIIELPVRNLLNRPIVVEGARVDCRSCLAPLNLPLSLSPGETRQLRIEVTRPCAEGESEQFHELELFTDVPGVPLVWRFRVSCNPALWPDFAGHPL